MDEDDLTPERTSNDKRGKGNWKVTEEDLLFLRAIVEECPVISHEDLTRRFQEKTGIRICRQTAAKHLMRMGLRKVSAKGMSSDTVESQASPVPDSSTTSSPAIGGEAKSGGLEGQRKRYGYETAHRIIAEGGYPSSLTDKEWDRIKSIFEETRHRRPRTHDLRRTVEACFYILRSGCSWRMLPREFPPWKSVYEAFCRWCRAGKFEKMYDSLRELWREKVHRAPDPTGAVMDSQSIRTSPQGGPKGFDAGKKIKGRKRHLLTDTLGLILAVVVTAANIPDASAAESLVAIGLEKYPSIAKIFVDTSYASSAAQKLRKIHGIEIEVARHPGNRAVGRWTSGQEQLPFIPKGFVPLPKRWVIERTNAWNLRPRRLVMDQDRKMEISTSWIWLAESRRLLRRLEHGSNEDVN